MDSLYEPYGQTQDAYQPGSILMSLVRGAAAPAQQPGLRRAPVQGDLQGMVAQMAARKYGWTGDQWAALQELVSRESGWNPQADNPTSSAYGLFQFLDSTRDNYGIGLNAGPRKQARAGLRYIQDRYGDPLSALSFHDENNWY